MVKLERELGPDTTDLSMRFGLHSGPVTAVRDGSFFGITTLLMQVAHRVCVFFF